MTERRFHRPAVVPPHELDAAAESADPAQLREAAHEVARALIEHGRSDHAGPHVERLVGLVQEVGLDALAEVWSRRPARSLPGALWRLYVLREWARSRPVDLAAAFAAGARHAQADHVVSGLAEPPEPAGLVHLADEILAGAFSGDLAVALHRAAAFCRVVAAGDADREHGPAVRGARLLDLASDLDACGALERTQRLE